MGPGLLKERPYPMIMRGLMRFARLDHFFTGVSIPMAAMRTAEDCGVGEFADIPKLAAWCASVGLEVIQVLPVNDTGANSSPYSALSAYALHPLYLRLQDLPGSESCASQIASFQRKSQESERQRNGHFSHSDVLSFKLQVADRLFDEMESDVLHDSEFASWLTNNPWVTAYAVFTVLKKESLGAPWESWGEMANPSERDITSSWKSHEHQCLRVAWIQHHLERQLASASHAAEGMGVFLKGDVPILMSRESADVWAFRRYFDLDANAGAPPDMFSPDGQNWGFPVYDWNALRADSFRWWKNRVLQAGKFFHALRIDHVLGFFRIWRIPRTELTGLVGHFSPSAGVTVDELLKLGHDKGRIRWLTLPHVTGDELTAALGSDAPRVAQAYLTRIGSESMYNIADSFDSEAALQSLSESQVVKDFLINRHGDRAFVAGEGDLRFPSWYIDRSKGFSSLPDGEKRALKDLLSRKRKESEDIWERRGRELLSMLQETTDMLVCAEDLGDVPDCVPKVLAELGILGLRIVRWSREYPKASAGQPARFIPPRQYPRLSVCTPSVHDTSTLRGWWEEDQADREEYYKTLGIPGPCPARMTPDLHQRIVSQCLETNSLLCMFQIQDILDLDQRQWSVDPRSERINVPGTVNDQNWTWRVPVDLKDLEKRADLTERLRPLVISRRGRNGETL